LRGETGAADSELGHVEEFSLFDEKTPAILGINVNGAAMATTTALNASPADRL
jgi:hypothetical protein